MESPDVSLLFFAFQVDLLFLKLQLFVQSFVLGLLPLNLLHQFLDLGLVGVHFLLKLLVRIFLCLVDILFQDVDCLNELVLSLFLDKNLLRLLDCWLTLQLLFGCWIVIFDGEDGKNTIETNREEFGIIICKPHFFNLFAMGLDFKCFLDEGFRIVAEDLD